MIELLIALLAFLLYFKICVSLTMPMGLGELLLKLGVIKQKCKFCDNNAYYCKMGDGTSFVHDPDVYLCKDHSEYDPSVSQLFTERYNPKKNKMETITDSGWRDTKKYLKLIRGDTHGKQD